MVRFTGLKGKSHKTSQHIQNTKHLELMKYHSACTAHHQLWRNIRKSQKLETNLENLSLNYSESIL